MLEAAILGRRDSSMPRPSILQSHEPAHRGMPQVKAAVPECELSLEGLVGLPPPGPLELSQCHKGRSETIMQRELGRLAQKGLPENAGRLTRLLSQAGHGVGEALGIAEFEPEVPFRLKLSLAHLDYLTLLTLTGYRRRSRLIIPQASVG